MSSPYDENLLASAPKATKSQLQDGYNADLLTEKTSSNPTRSSVNPEITNHPSPAPVVEVIPLTKEKVPFYRTRNGIIIIVLVVIVIIAAVVGGAVGGTAKKSSKSLSVSQASSLISTATAGGQGVGLLTTTTRSSSSSPSLPSPSPSTMTAASGL